MKVAFITDTHFGIRNGSEVYLNYFEKFFREVFFPYCREHGIKRIVHGGDLFDHRKFLNLRVASRVKSFFTDIILEEGMELDIIVGNHCCYYKNTNDINSLREFLPWEYNKNIRIYEKPTNIEIDGLEIALIPWISPEIEEETLNFINETSAPIAVGHLEIGGFQMLKNLNHLSEGYSIKTFNKFDAVYSGHYHTKSKRENITYLGAPYEMYWADWDDPKSFHVLDTETREMTPIDNCDPLFIRIDYDDSNGPLEMPVSEKFKDKYVKVCVVQKNNPHIFDTYVDQLSKCSPADIKVFELLHSSEISNEDLSEYKSVENTEEILNKYVESMQSDGSSNEKLKKMVRALYMEAVDVQ